MRPTEVYIPTTRARRHCKPQFPFYGFKPVALNPDYIKESPAKFAKAIEAPPATEPPQTFWVGLTPKAVPEVGEFCPGYRQALPMSDAVPDLWGPVGKIQSKLEMVRARGHWVRDHPSTPHPTPICVLLTAFFFLPHCPGLWPCAMHVDMCPIALTGELFNSLGGVDLAFHLRPLLCSTGKRHPRAQQK